MFLRNIEARRKVLETGLTVLLRNIVNTEAAPTTVLLRSTQLHHQLTRAQACACSTRSEREPTPAIYRAKLGLRIVATGAGATSGGASRVGRQAPAAARAR